MKGTVDLRPDSFTEGGGLIDDFDGTIADIRFIMTDYDGKMVDAVPVAKVVYTVDGDEVGTDLLSVGGKDDFVPNDSGMGLVKLKSRDSLTKTSKFGMFMAAIVESGFPLNKMDSDDISYLVSTNGHFLRKVVEYKGLVKKGDRDSTVLLCTKINMLPWDAEKGGKGKKGKSGKVDAGLADDVAEIVQSILVDAEGDVSKKGLMSALFKDEKVAKLLAELPNKKAALKLATDDKFLKSREEWEYEDGVLKMG